MPTHAEILEQRLQRMNDHSKRLKDYESSVKDYSRLALVVERLMEKVNGNGKPGMDEQIRDNSKEIEAQRKELAALVQLKETIQPMILFYKIGAWMATALGASILALIWSILTGQVELVFK